jgi:CRP/FNR family transcriptional regulator, cyclic AMP receptor protein
MIMETEKIMAFAKNVPLFQGLTNKELSAVCSLMILREFHTGEIIVQKDDNEGQAFFIMISGTAHVSVITSEGKQTILATLKRSDFFGEIAILDGEPRSASVIAAEDCKVFMLYRKPFLDILHRFPKITIQMLIEMSKRLRKSNRQINTLSLISAYGRIADVILRISKEQGYRVGNVMIIPKRPTHQMIAEMAGTSRETVSRIMSTLQKKHYIAIDRKKITILDEAKLYD